MQITANITDDDEEDSDSDSDYEPNEETALETYTTPLDEDNCEIDEYFVFKEVMQRLQSTEPEWYQALTNNLTEQQSKALMEISLLADQRKAARESKKIEQQGGLYFRYIPRLFPNLMHLYCNYRCVLIIRDRLHLPQYGLMVKIPLRYVVW
ncbi:importin-7-like [Photinus pyralis]|uniref:importin-7-like n=1 Tax=Photinus pyralis TaxID=7054 RepID=UPI001266F61E|nr:importin-7-like [Photinus pyralis]